MFRNSSQRVCLALSFVVGSWQAVHADDAPRASLESRLVEAGREQFTRVRQLAKMQADAAHDTDRYFNAQSCVECHKLGGIGGAGPNTNNVQLINTTAVLLRPRERIVIQEERHVYLRPNRTVNSTGGDAVDKLRAARDRFVPLGNEGILILHRRSTVPEYAEWRLDMIQNADPLNPEVIGRKMAEPEGRCFVCGSQPRGPDPFEERNTPPLFGLGLIAGIPQAEIDAIAAGQPDDIRGRAPRLRTGGIGRFGWKSQTATLADFNEGACAAELGLKTAKFTPAERLTFRSRAPGVKPTELPKANPVDMTAGDLAALTAYVASLPEPKQIIDAEHDLHVADGARAFHTAGCAVCHVPDVGGIAGIYSDLLLHSVGTSGSAAYYGSLIGPQPTEFDIVQSTEIRTPPLWGVADSGPYLHDGSAPTLEAAILKHNVQAEKSVRLYQDQLNAGERKNLRMFLESLRAPRAEPDSQRKIATARYATCRSASIGFINAARRAG